MAAAAACGDSSGPTLADGLTPGTYTVRFELAPTVATPEPLQGRHDFTFRVREPATSAADVELVSSRRLPPDDAPAAVRRRIATSAGLPDDKQLNAELVERTEAVAALFRRLLAA